MLITLAILAVAGALVATLLAIRRLALRGESVLLLLEREMPPMATQLRTLAEELRVLSRQAGRELDQIGTVVGRLDDLSRRMVKVVGFVGGMTRVGQVVGTAAGIKRGLDVFMAKLMSRNRGH